MFIFKSAIIMNNKMGIVNSTIRKDQKLLWRAQEQLNELLMVKIYNGNGNNYCMTGTCWYITINAKRKIYASS